jgi:hypothetical protein
MKGPIKPLSICWVFAGAVECFRGRVDELEMSEAGEVEIPR